MVKVLKHQIMEYFMPLSIKLLMVKIFFGEKK